MATVLQSRSLIDPLHDFSDVDLLPQTIKGLVRNGKPKQDDLQSVLEALAVKSSSTLQQHAQTVLNSSSELLKSEFPRGLQPVYKDRDIPPRDKVRPQERRPAMELSRKRARFSMKPNISQSSLGEDMSLNIDELQDPEEVFRSFENIERANKELRKQRGEISTDFTQRMSHTKARSHRPGLLGRKAGFKSQYSSIAANLDETLGISQEVSEVDLPSPSNSVLNLSTTHELRVSQETELADDGSMGATQDSSHEEKNEVDGFLNELLSEDLDADKTVKLLQERLQFKPINLNELSLTKVDGVHRSDAKLSLEQHPRPIESLLTARDSSKRAKGEVSVDKQQLVLNSTHTPDFPIPPTKQVSSVSMLSSRLSEAGQPGISFFLSEIGNKSPTRNSRNEGTEKGTPSPHVYLNSDSVEINEHVLRDPDKVASIISEDHEDNITVLDKAAKNDSTHSIDPVDDNSRESVDHMNPGSNHCDGDLEEEVEDLQMLGTVGKEKNPVNRNLELHKMVADDFDHSVDAMEDNVEDIQQMETLVAKQVEKICEDPHYTESQFDILGSTVDKDNNLKDGQSESTVQLPENNTQESQESSSELLDVPPQQEGPSLRKLPRRKNSADIPGPVHQDGHEENSTKFSKKTKKASPSEALGARIKQKGASLRRISQGKISAGEELSQVENKQSKKYMRDRQEFSRRKSLAGAGMQWQGDLRRSTRKRVKPLEFWRGEKLVYRRTHESVLGAVGYCHYVKGEKNPVLTVESFLSDESDS